MNIKKLQKLKSYQSCIRSIHRGIQKKLPQVQPEAFRQTGKSMSTLGFVYFCSYQTTRMHIDVKASNPFTYPVKPNSIFKD